MLRAYYAAIAPWMLPHVVGRPLTIVRCPGGPQCVYARHCGHLPHVPAALRTAQFRKTGKLDFFVEDAAGLLALLELDAVEIHLWGSRMAASDKPDRIRFDLDPGEGVQWERIVRAAVELRDRLAGLKLASWVMTSGSKGLYVTVPIEPGEGWPVVKAFSRRLVEQMAADAPGEYTASSEKAGRSGRIFIDYLRNDNAATGIAPYSVRARSDLSVATPLAWEELPRVTTAAQFRTADVLKRKSTGAEPWARMNEVRQNLQGAPLR